MAAYSAVACFRQTLKQLLDSGQFPEVQIQSLHDNVFSLQSSLDNITFVPKSRREDMNEMQTRIREAIYEAQDKFEYWIKGNSSEKSDEASFKKIADDVDRLAKEAEETADEIRLDPQAQNLLSENPEPSRPGLRSRDTIVGQEKDFKTVTDQMVSEDKQRVVIPITGLPGIGKTTLARSIYDNQEMIKQFSIRAWVTVSVSKEYDFKEIFSKILSSMESKSYPAGHYAKQGDEQTLLSHLRQELYNLKYLIVVDDVWDAKVYNRVIQALPDEENGSRVLLSSRIPRVAASIKKSVYIHKMKPLNLSLGGRDTIVGQEEDFKTVSDQLTSKDEQRVVILITGIPGIGKTTLARSIYDNQEMINQYDIRAWVTVSQEYNFQEIFSKILSSMESKNYPAGHYAKQGDEQTLLSHLHQELYNVKYLIVVDDVWDAKGYNGVIQALPNREKKSRVLLTSRIQKIAASIEKSVYIHKMKPLYNLSLGGRDTIVGQEKDFKIVTDQLTAEDKQRVVIPIIGLPGIGKTTLARSIYDNQEMIKQYDIRAWVTVSQEYNIQEIFSIILSSMESKNYPAGHHAKQGDEQTLLKHLHQELYNLKYLIVVDDVWDTKVWDRVIQALPDKENGSRVLLTSRIPMVAKSIQKTGNIHMMMPLSVDDSWTLLCYKVFDEEVVAPNQKNKDITEACPPHLREIGRSIAWICHGVPLLLTVVGGLLLQEREKIDYWRRIEEDIADAAAKGGDESFLEILSLSYDYLPDERKGSTPQERQEIKSWKREEYLNNAGSKVQISKEILSLNYDYLPGKLKGCFLYMGAFPEDSAIRVSKLIKLWVAEGFLTLPPPPQSSTLEDVARRSLEDLVERNLITVHRKSSNGGMKVCGMNSSLRELAENECRKEKFFHSRKKYVQELEKDMQIQRRVSVHRNILMCLEEVYESTKSIKEARSLLYVGPHHHHPLSFCLTFDLLRVLDAFTVYFIEFPHEFLKLIHLRYLSFTYNDDISPKIAQLENLQVLMVRREPKIIFVGVSFLPDEIWEMPQLRHLWFTETDFPALPSQIPENRGVLLENLQTLANVNAAFFTDEVLDNMPNLTKLSMWLDSPAKINFSLKKLSKLEFLEFVVMNPIPKKQIEVTAEDLFPTTVKRLSLSGCGLPWEYMKFVATKLKDLEVLKLRELAFYGDAWCPDYKLEKLKYLLIEYLNFRIWEASDRNFPILERLILRHCYELEEIPEDIVYIEPLELIEMVDCSPKAVESAEAIEQELKDLGKTTLVRVFSSWE